MGESSKYIDQFSDLHTAKKLGMPAPHKAVLLFTLSCFSLLPLNTQNSMCVQLYHVLARYTSKVCLRSRQ